MLPGEYNFHRLDTFALVGQEDNRPLPLEKIHLHRGALHARLAETPDRPAFYKLVIDQTARGGRQHAFDYAARSVERIRIALTFDDGPTPAGDPGDGRVEGSPTARVLEVLRSYAHGRKRQRRGLAAVFFVLTGPDRFMGRTYPKGETADGRALMARAHREGHLLAAHWGGSYSGQGRHHTSRVDFDGDGKDDDGDGKADEDAPYDINGDGRPDGRHALESDLSDCASRIEKATGRRPEFVRPPEWVWRMSGRPEVGAEVLATYRRLGLRMILSDARVGDGGYTIVSKFSLEKRQLSRSLRAAVLAGHADVVVTMHDSNRQTAARVEGWLRRIERVLKATRLGGKKLRAWRDFTFVADREDLADLLRAKREYGMFPGARVGPPPEP
jgi:peptidoglycan/xylan/chitin deacetylase (PgdA/CDA1 family)